MSEWVRGRRTGAVASWVFHTLAMCRVKARGLSLSRSHAAAGNVAKSQVHAKRAERGLSGVARKAKAKELRAARKAPKPPKEPGFALKRESVQGKKTFRPENTGAGRTPYMLDMKKGDLPGQTSLLERVASVPTHPSPAAALVQKSRHLMEVRARTAERLRALKPLRDVERAPEIHAKPGDKADVKTEHIHFDPERFQYKIGAAAHTGSVGSLSGVKKYDPELAGVVSVWRDPENGKVYVVNGHNRLDLAKRLGVEKVSAKFLVARDATEARAKGAVVNIAEGRGTSLDAAKFFRDTGITKERVAEMGIPMREKVASEGLDLAKLDDRLFRKVVNGDLSPGRAAIIGGSGLSHAQQFDLDGQLERMGRKGHVNDQTLRELVDNARSAGSRTRETFDLFGASHEEQSLAIHRATVQSAIKRELAGERKLFGLVSKSKAAQDLAEKGRSTIDVETTGKVSEEAAGLLGVFDTLKNRSGPVAAHLNRAAERIADGEPSKKVIREARTAISGEIQRMLEGGASAFAA
jgi:hypothetical protein